MTARGRFLYKSLSKSLKYDMWLRGRCHFHYNSLSKSLKYDPWLLWAISFTIPHQNDWNMTCDSYGPFHHNSLLRGRSMSTTLQRGEVMKTRREGRQGDVPWAKLDREGSFPRQPDLASSSPARNAENAKHVPFSMNNCRKQYKPKEHTWTQHFCF